MALKEFRKQGKIASIAELVFLDEMGKRSNYKYLQRTLRKVAPRRIRIHDLRHTYATLSTHIAKGIIFWTSASS